MQCILLHNWSVLISYKFCPGTDLTGSEHNDEFYMDEAGNVRTRTNQSGGVQVFFPKTRPAGIILFIVQ